METAINHPTFGEFLEEEAAPAAPALAINIEEDEKPLPRNLDELIQQKVEDQMDAGLITITLTPSGFGGLPLPEGLLLPEALPVPNDSEEGRIETERIIDGFIGTGSKEEQIAIKGRGAGEGMPLIEGLEDAEQSFI